MCHVAVRITTLAHTFVHSQKNPVIVHGYQLEPMHMAIYLYVGYHGSHLEIQVDQDDSIAP